MNRDRFSAIAHAGIDYAGPFAASVFEHVIDMTAPSAGASAIDIGCGKAELLIRLAERAGVRGIGLERSQLMHDEAIARARQRDVAHLVSIQCGDASTIVAALSDASNDVVTCVGSGHALGAGDALATLARFARPNGFIVWGEGYWKKPPSAEYLTRLGGSADECGTHASNVARGAALGLVPCYATTASDREWDEYEWAYNRNVETFVARNPDDPDAGAMLERIRTWRDLVLDEGRDTMGFGLYVFRR